MKRCPKTRGSCRCSSLSPSARPGKRRSIGLRQSRLHARSFCDLRRRECKYINKWHFITSMYLLLLLYSSIFILIYSQYKERCASRRRRTLRHEVVFATAHVARPAKVAPSSSGEERVCGVRTMRWAADEWHVDVQTNKIAHWRRRATSFRSCQTQYWSKWNKIKEHAILSNYET